MWYMYRQSPKFSSVTKTLFLSTLCKYEITECFTKVQQVFLLYHWGSLLTFELISLIPLVGSLEENPLAVKLLDNLLCIPP